MVRSLATKLRRFIPVLSAILVLDGGGLPAVTPGGMGVGGFVLETVTFSILVGGTGLNNGL